MLPIDTTPLLGEFSSKAPSGVFKQLCKITLPLMLATLSGSLMMFVDRLVLARYSLDAMNAATSTGMTFAIFQFGALSIAAIAEVFVGQFNGAKQFYKIGPSVWQMIWFALGTTILFWGLGLSAHWFVPDELAKHGLPFFKTLAWLGTAFPLFAALTSFYIGRGQVAIVTLSVIMSGLLNLGLDLVLVFGWGPFPELGAKGAALATGIAQWSSVLILFWLFLGKKHQTQYHTHHYHFNWELFSNCLKIGAPNAIGHMLVISCWALMLNLLSQVSFEHMTVFAVGQSVWILTNFITDGGSKGAMALTANLIGASKLDRIDDVLKAGIKLHCCFMLIALIPLLIFPEYLVGWFLPETANPELVNMSIIGCRWVFLAFFFDGLLWLVIGILTAGGDTRFIMIMTTLGAWLFGLLPVYIFVHQLAAPPPMTLFFLMLFTSLTFACFYLRLRKGNWLKLQLNSR